jgi:hypothetical protein
MLITQHHQLLSVADSAKAKAKHKHAAPFNLAMSNSTINHRPQLTRATSIQKS